MWMVTTLNIVENQENNTLHMILKIVSIIVSWEWD